MYLKDLFRFYTPQRDLRSADDPLKLVNPKTNLVTHGDRAFSSKAADEWNKLPLKVRSSATVGSFKSQLKTHLFRKRFCADD